MRAIQSSPTYDLYMSSAHIHSFFQLQFTILRHIEALQEELEYNLAFQLNIMQTGHWSSSNSWFNLQDQTDQANTAMCKK